MANIETSVTELKINKLTKEQYESIASPSNTELYFVKDEAIDYNDLVNTPNITSSVTANSNSLLTSGGAYSDLVREVQSGNASNQIKVTKGTNTSTITINNVENATNAEIASKLGSNNVGDTNTPIYLNNGTATPINYTIAKSVPADAKFTDTIYNVFTGATSSTSGTTGLVKAPAAGDQNKFLKGNGNWEVIDSFPSQSGNEGKYLTTNGTSVSWNALAGVANSGSYNDLTNKPSFNGISLDNTTTQSFFGTSNSAAIDTEKQVSIPSITELKEGQIIIVIPTITSTVADSTLKLNNFTAYPIRYGSAAITTSTNSIVWNANYPSMFLFNGSYWIFLGHGFDKDTIYTLNYSIDAGKYISGTGDYAITRYSIVAQKPNMTWEKITATNADYSTENTKSVNASGFLLNQLRYYSTTANLANGGAAASNVIYEKAASINFAYSSNCSTTPGWAVGNYIYLVGTINKDGLFYLDTAQWWSNALPTSNDGKLYIRLGIALTTTDATMSFFEDRPIFYHNGTKICEYKVADNKQDLLVSGTNIKTINNTSLLGNGNISITGLPSQTGQNGKYLTTNGSIASWSTVDVLPSQTGNDGKYLTTNGTTASWVAIEEYTANDVETLWNSI